jgi:hypothetical protein
MKNADTKVFPESTASDRFVRLCTDFQLKHKVIHKSDFILPAKIYDSKTIADMVEDSIDLTLINAGKWYIVRDNFGILEFLDMAALRTNLVLGDASLMTTPP